MEILNNIWTVLSTPNEELINVLLALSMLIESFLFVTILTSILNIKANSKQILIYVIFSTLVGIIDKNIIPEPINVIINYLVMIVLSKFIFKITFLKSSISIISSALIFALVGTLTLNPYLTIMHITSEQLNTIFIYRSLYLLVIYFTMAIIIVILRNRNLKINLLDDLDKKTVYIIFANLILGIITLIVQSFITFYYIDTLPILITFLSFISLLAYFTISIYSITRIMKLILTTKKLESAEEYNKTLRILHDSVRGFKHDFDNIVTTIGGYVRTNDMEGLKSYYVQLEDDCQRVNNLYLLNPEIVNNPRYL